MPRLLLLVAKSCSPNTSLNDGSMKGVVYKDTDLLKGFRLWATGLDHLKGNMEASVQVLDLGHEEQLTSITDDLSSHGLRLRRFIPNRNH